MCWTVKSFCQAPLGVALLCKHSAPKKCQLLGKCKLVGSTKGGGCRDINGESLRYE